MILDAAIKHSLFVSSFLVGFSRPSSSSSFFFLKSNPQATSSVLSSGIGIAKDYTWREEAFEIEVTVPVPPNTKAKDISFKALPTSISLSLQDSKTETKKRILLDPERALRGKVVVDGTYWVISDADEETNQDVPKIKGQDIDDDDTQQQQQAGRVVTVTIEKQIRQAKDDFDVIDYDWNGVYREEEEGEVSYRKYDEPEELDVREYAASLGVDIDNINMSMVDKTMFSSGLKNMTQKKSILDSLTESGLVQEVTQQKDGSEWTTDDDGEKVPFHSMGKGVTQEELRRQSVPVDSSSSSENNDEDEDDDNVAAVGESSSKAIPFLDTDSPWHKTVPAEEREIGGGNGASAASSPNNNNKSPKENEKKRKKQKKEQLQKQREKEAIDPIGTLTVSRLREILRSRGMKVSGNKKELQDRLRAEVNSMMQMMGEEATNDDSSLNND
eukprot:scaffold2447_cov110-Cylindrotheca_fusiformis.AAC.14